MIKSYEWAIWFVETEYILAKNGSLSRPEKFTQNMVIGLHLICEKVETLCLHFSWLKQSTHIYLHTPILNAPPLISSGRPWKPFEGFI